MSKPKDNRSALERVEEALKWFWRKNSGTKMMKAKNAEFIVEPKVFIGGKINPEIARLIIKRYLERVTPEDIIDKKVVIMEEKVVINDDEGNQILDVKSKSLINKMVNRLTNMVGLELSEKMSKQGVPYLHSEAKDRFSYGDIKEALIQFMADMERADSKNLMRDAVLIINSGDGYKQLVSPAKTKNAAA